MKIIILPLFLFTILSCATNKMQVHILPQKSVEIDFKKYDLCEARVSNKSMQGIEVKVIEPETQAFIRGFGLGKKSTAKVLVEKNKQIILQNTTNSPVQLSLRFLPTTTSVTTATAAGNKVPNDRNNVNFTLQNTSAKSIPLIIPSVMNPNLSPFSKSGVDLKMGQEILFREKGKNYVLLVVDKQIQSGQVLDVAQLLQARRRELGLR